MPIPPRSSPSRVRVVELLTFPLVQLLDVTGPAQVFASANEFVLESGGRPPYELKVVAQGGAQVTASAGLKPSTQSLPQEGSLVDTLMVAGGRGVEAAAADPVIVDWVQMRAKRARRIASIERLQVEAARRLLAESGLPAKRISQRCGFGSQETMHRSFLRLRRRCS